MNLRDRVFSSKKGFSPLIATVLLISFAVALGAVVISSFQERLPLDAETSVSVAETGCSSQVRMEISNLNDNPHLCYGEDGSERYVYFGLDNVGEKDIKRIHLGIHGDSAVYTNTGLDVTKMIAGVGATRQNVSYSYEEYGALQQVVLTPIVETEKGEEVCSDSSIRIDSSEISRCGQN